MPDKDDLEKCTDQLARALTKMQEEIHKGAIYVVGNSKDITSLQEWQVRQNGALQKIEKLLTDINKSLNTDLNDLKLEVAKGKPTWAMAYILAFLSSITVGAIVFALRTVAP